MNRNLWILTVVGMGLLLVDCKAVPNPTTTPKPPLAEIAKVEQARPSATGTLTPRSISTVTPSPLPTLTATVNSLPSVTPTIDILVSISKLFPTPTFTPLPKIPTSIQAGTEEIALIPGQPKPYLSTFRLVAFYGHPNSPELGILGQLSREDMVAQLRSTAAEYQTLLPNQVVLPTIHFISTVANQEAGESGLYNQRTNLNTLAEWVVASQAEGLAFIFDIQPGKADIMMEFERIRPFLYYPHVHLALDPEFTMTKNQIPGQDLGSLHADQINTIQAALSEIAVESGLNKVLIIHQFETSMVAEKSLIQDYPFVELVFDADGFGTPQTKISDLQQYADEPGWEYGGLKLFFTWDTPLLAPKQVLEIQPQPVIVIYQ